ncbi:'B' spike structural protein [Fiji disease virus]|uniref:Putative structural protein VP3 n=9 Tax=Fiji disease virus TaxID=77698 RepID=VP3_FDVS|nr:'B' spike structural protein [Fiji disease virus]Q8QV02.1 RecName: Full=Putative structural protein VP3 [Fiji disease virus isolate Sugarcane]AAM00233.1 'B' spike structural protein [Fiji disease virus]
METDNLLKYLISQNTEQRIEQIENWQTLMQQSGYTSDYLTATAGTLRTKREIQHCKDVLSDISMKRWNTSLTQGRYSSDQLFFGLNECSGTNKALVDRMKINFNFHKLNFHGFAKYWILNGDFDKMCCYDSDRTKLFLTKKGNHITIDLNGITSSCNITNVFGHLTVDDKFEPNFDILIRIVQKDEYVVCQFINFTFNPKIKFFKQQPFTIEFIGNTLYFCVNSQLIFDVLDGYKGKDDLSLRDYYLCRIAYVNLLKLEHALEQKQKLDLGDENENLAKYVHQLALNALTGVSKLSEETIRTKTLSMELGYKKNIDIGIASQKILINQFTHDLFNNKFVTDFIGWNYTYGECDIEIAPIVCNLLTYLDNESSLLNSGPLSYTLLDEFGGHDRMFILQVKDESGNDYRMLCELQFSLKYKKFSYQGLKVFNADNLEYADCYLFGFGQNQVYGEKQTLNVNSIVSDKQGNLVYHVHALSSLVCRFKVISERIEYLGNALPTFNATLTFNKDLIKMSGNLRLVEDFDGSKKTKYLLSDEFTLENTILVSINFNICEGKQTNSAARYNGKTWPGLRSRDFKNDFYENDFEVVIHNLNYHSQFNEHSNRSDILYSACNCYHFVESDSCFTNRDESYLYWKVNSQTIPMEFDSRPYIKLYNRAFIQIPVLMKGGSNRIIGPKHKCLLNEDYYVNDYQYEITSDSPRVYLPYPNSSQIISIVDSAGKQLSNTLKIESFDVSKFNVLMLPDRFNNSLDVVGELITFKNELELMLRTNNVLYSMLHSLENRIINLERFCEHLNKTYEDKFNKASSIVQFLGDVFIFIGEMSLVQFPVLGIGLIFVGTLLDGMSRILKEDYFDGISEILISSLLLFLGERKMKYSFLEKLGFGKIKTESNLVLNEKVSSVGKRRSYSAYYASDDHKEFDSSLTLRDRLLRQIRSQNPVVFDFHHNSGVMIELKNKQKPSYQALNSSYTRIKRAIGSVGTNNGLERKLNDITSENHYLKSLLITTFDYFTYQVTNSIVIVFKVVFEVKIDGDDRSVEIINKDILYYRNDLEVAFSVFNSCRYDELTDKFPLKFKFEYSDFVNYMYVVCFLSKFGSKDNLLLESYDKFYDSLYLYSSNSDVFSSSINSNNMNRLIYKISHMSAFRTLEQDQDFLTILIRVKDNSSFLRL